MTAATRQIVIIGGIVLAVVLGFLALRPAAPPPAPRQAEAPPPAETAAPETAQAEPATPEPALPDALPPGPPPSFDVVRVAADGGALVAGAAAPGAAVVLRVDGTAVAETVADANGQFVILFLLEASDDPQAMTLEYHSADGRVSEAPDTVILSPRPAVLAALDPVDGPAAEDPAAAPPAAVEPAAEDPSAGPTPDPATDAAPVPASADAAVMSARDAPADRSEEAPVEATPEATADTAERSDDAPPPVPALADARAPDPPVADSLAQTDTLPAPRPAAPTETREPTPPALAALPPGSASAPALAPPPEARPTPPTAAPDAPQTDSADEDGPAAERPTPGTRAAEAGMVEAERAPDTAPADAAAQADAPALPPAFLLRDSGVVEMAANAPQPGNAVVIDAISYDDSGDVLVSGRAGRGDADARVQLYLDNRPLALAQSERGAWSAVLPDLEPGLYTLRADQLDAEGRVATRFETPFQRAEPATIPRPAARPDGSEGPAVQLITVQPGNSLWRISRIHYGEGVRYVQIYQANRELIRDPDLIYPGQVFVLPD